MDPHVSIEPDAAALAGTMVLTPEHLGEVFEQHHRAIWGYVARLAGPDVADDLVGEVFLDAFRNRDRFDPSRGHVRSWLFGIATNRLRGRYRSDSQASRAFRKAAEVPNPVIDISQDVADADYLAQQMRLVRKALGSMKRADRELLVLAVWEGMSYEEISLALEIPVGTVRSRLSRTRGRLRELMAANENGKSRFGHAPFRKLGREGGE